MAMILLFKPSDTALVMKCWQYVTTFSNSRLIIWDTFFPGAQRLRIAHWFHWPKNRFAQPVEV